MGRRGGGRGVGGKRFKRMEAGRGGVIAQELCESRGDRLGLSGLTSLVVSVDVKPVLNWANVSSQT